MIKSIFYILTFLVVGISWANPLKTYVFNNDYNHLSLYYQYLEDCKSMSEEQVVEKFQSGVFKKPTPNAAFNSGITSCSYWLVVDVLNKTDLEQKFLWSFYNNGLLFKVYELQNQKLVYLGQSSMNESLEKRPYAVRSVSFPFYLSTNQSKTLFVKVTSTNSENIYFPTDITNVEDYLLYEIGFSYQLGKFFGILFLMVFINFSLFVILRQKIYLYNTFYILFIILFQLSDFHFDVFEIPNPVFRNWSFISKPVFVAVALFFYIKVFQIFVAFESHFPKTNTFLKQLNKILLASAILLFICNFFVNDHYYIIKTVNNWVSFLIYSSLVLMFVLIVIGTMHKIRFFMLFGISFIFLFYGFITTLLKTLNIVNLPIIKPGNILVGMVVEVTLLTLFFVYKFKIEKELSASKIFNETKMNQQLTKKMLTIESEEQERLSKNIHDEIGSDITGLRMQLENQFLKSNIDLQNQEEIIENVKSIYEKTRNFSHFIDPNSFKSNFVQSIESQFNFYKKNTKSIDFQFFTNIENELNIENDIKIQINRIFKEIITNALKHAFSTKISLQLIIEKNELILVFEDNGIGFNPKAALDGFGLQNIKSRVAFLSGKLNIDSNNKGTTIIIEIPIKS